MSGEFFHPLAQGKIKVGDGYAIAGWGQLQEDNDWSLIIHFIVSEVFCI